MKVYVLTAGSYSDYHIVAVFTERWKAEWLSDRLYSKRSEWYPKIEEYDTDVIDDNRMQWEYMVILEKGEPDSESAWESADYELALTSAQLNKVVKEKKWGNVYYNCKVLAADKETALKIGRDLVAEFRAREEGVG
jgi:hypothetical protein